MGNVQQIPSPELPGALEHGAKVAGAITEAMDAGVGKEELNAIRADASKDGPSDVDYMQHWAKPECREIDRANERIVEQNAQKRARASAIARGENINMRVDRCDGDPANIVA